MPERIKSTHKNASRSRHLIKQAYGELLNEKDPLKISVTDIVERANISRGTFYAHYLDVYDLSLAIENNVIEALNYAVNQLGLENVILDPTAAVMMGMEFLESNKTYFALFVNSSRGDMLIGRIIQFLEDRFSPALDEMFPDEKQHEIISLFLIYTVGAFKRVILAWFGEKIHMSARECAEKLLEIYRASRPAELKALAEKKDEN
jgi:AcrR family transcriptional regulator